MRPHPLAEPSAESRLDILVGGKLEAVMAETLAILRQSVKKLERGERAMVLNSLVSERQMEHALGRWFDPAKVLNASYSPDRVIEKLDFLERTIESHDVRLLIVNSFEFSAVMPSARMQLMRFLSRLVMERNIRVVVMLRALPRSTQDGTFVTNGPLGLMCFLAKSVSDIGWYGSVISVADLFATQANPGAQFEDELPEFNEQDAGHGVEEDYEEKVEVESADELAEEWVVRPQEELHEEAHVDRLRSEPVQLLKGGGRSLKNKELEFAVAA